MGNNMGGGKGKKDVNAKLTTNFINTLKYKTNQLKQNQQTRLQINSLRCKTNDHRCKTNEPTVIH
jgi:hypothetical protein